MPRTKPAAIGCGIGSAVCRPKLRPAANGPDQSVIHSVSQLPPKNEVGPRPKRPSFWLFLRVATAVDVAVVVPAIVDVVAVAVAAPVVAVVDAFADAAAVVACCCNSHRRQSSRASVGSVWLFVWLLPIRNRALFIIIGKATGTSQSQYWFCLVPLRHLPIRKGPYYTPGDRIKRLWE